ncbi:hypothetical protein BG011_007112 [Mortierella polycephala]|uniref:LUD domain-containing protein n=1 Tax=Mortierella polycephala TaxID=41804 RepID=A0A9P6TYM8_9FUNG|nr:hypothetical protein BG011_007112 [Mortierella polycephala]
MSYLQKRALTTTFRSVSWAAKTLARPLPAFAAIAHRSSQQLYSTSSSESPVARPKSTFDDVTFSSLVKSDPELAKYHDSKYQHPASDEAIEKARQGLEARGFTVYVVNNKDEAFDKIRSLIPAGSSINSAHSTTLEEIGFINYLMDNNHPWNNIRGTILKEKDPAKQYELRRLLGTTADYFLTSMSAITEQGEMAHGDFSGTKVGGVAFGAGNVIVVAGSNKIVKDEAEAWKRTKEFALPGVSAFSRKAFNMTKSYITNYEVLRQANPMAPDRVQVVLVKEALGF